MCGEEAVLSGGNVEDERFSDGYRGLNLQVVKEGFDADAFVGGVLVDEDQEMLGLRGADAYEDEFTIDLRDNVGNTKRKLGQACGEGGGGGVKDSSNVVVHAMVTASTEQIKMRVAEGGLWNGFFSGGSKHRILPLGQQVVGPRAFLRGRQSL